MKVLSTVKAYPLGTQLEAHRHSRVEWQMSLIVNFQLSLLQAFSINFEAIAN